MSPSAVPAFEDLTDREKVERMAGLVFNIGTIIEDRRDGEPPFDQAEREERNDALWAYLWENVYWFYERIGHVMDEVEDEIYGKEEA